MRTTRSSRIAVVFVVVFVLRALPRLVRLRAAAAISFAAFRLMAGCGMLPNLPPPLGNAAAQVVRLIPPVVTYQGAELVKSPSHRLLASYYCPEVVSLPFNSAPVACRGFFGARPTPNDMDVGFALRFKVKNPNQIPLPLANVLTAATVFPAVSNQSLGAVCTQLCPEGDTTCTGGSNPTACEASSRDVRSLSDFGVTTVNLIVSEGVAAAFGGRPTFIAPKVSSASELDVIVRFAFGPEQLLRVMRQLAVQSADELKVGRTPTFTIPFQLQGTVFFDAGSFGRLPVAYGPVAGNWALPTDGLLPR